MAYVIGVFAALFSFLSIPWTSAVLFPYQVLLSLLMVTVCGFIYILFKKSRGSLEISSFLPPLLLLIISSVSMLFTVDRVQSLSQQGGWAYIPQASILVLSIWILVQEFFSKELFKKISFGFLLTSIFGQIYVLFGYIFAFGWFVNPFGTLLSLSVFSAISLCVALYMLIDNTHVPVASFSILVSIFTLLITDWYVIPAVSFSLCVLGISFGYLSIAKGIEFVKTKMVLGVFASLFVLQLCAPWISNFFATQSDKFLQDRSNVQVELPTSIAVIEKVFADSFTHVLFGTGPNTYTYAWHRYKPTELPNSVNITKYWDYDFEEAGSIVLTYITTYGVLGLLFWIYIFSLVYVYIRKSIIEKDIQYMCIGGVSVFLSIAILFSSVNFGLYLLFFICISVLYKEYGNVFFIPKATLIKRYLYILLLICLLVLGWKEIGIYRSVSFVDSALIGLYSYAHQGVDEISEAETKVLKGIGYFDSGEYRRLLSTLQTAKVDLGMNSTSTSKEYLKKAEEYLKPSMSHSVNFRDWMQMGRIYEYQTLLGATSSAPLAYQAYTIASVLAPTHPEPQYALALVHMYAGNIQMANESIKKVLLLKPNYTDAVLLYKQLNATNTNILGNMGI